jgi:phosphoglycolate phosphatase-like HAD superfamily hydrolase
MSNPKHQNLTCRLVLFDIDGTLLNAAGGGRVAFSRALKAAFGGSGEISHINFSGATDLRVLHQLLREQGVEPESRHEERFFRHLPEEMERALTERPPLLFPGVRELLDALTRDSAFALGIVTGNQEGSARAKLRHAGLDAYFRFGGFGCDHADRVEIARQAIARGPGSRSGFLIGDTPSDIQAAHACGLTAIGVATGTFAPDILERSGADYVLDALHPVEAVLSILRT